LSGIFIENDIQYTPEDYHEHLALTMKTADENVEIITTPTVPFRNIQIAIRSGEWVVISKSKAPAIHFCIKHPVIVRALTDFAPPIRD
ncbi:MAG: hypothetical protein J6Y89_08195, partial [Lachnospiraceae bacterium]|nr:hypothetical protein [Lachnospiraceae bacterium]